MIPDARRPNNGPSKLKVILSWLQVCEFGAAQEAQLSQVVDIPPFLVFSAPPAPLRVLRGKGFCFYFCFFLVDFSSRVEDHSIALVFQDQTAMRFDIEPGFQYFFDLYSHAESGQLRILSWTKNHFMEERACAHHLPSS